MLELLDELIEELPEMVGRGGPDWNNLKIDYDTPLVHRLWLPWRDEYRINLHKLFPCEPDQALWHPHSWPSAVMVLHGEYVMRQGEAKGRCDRPKVSTTVRMTKGSAYEMTNRLSWHSVAPTRETYTVMLTGPLYEDKWTEQDMQVLGLPKLKHDLGGLSKEEQTNMLDMIYFFVKGLKHETFC